MANQKSIHKAYREYLDLYYLGHRKFSEFVDDKRLTQTEKVVLNGWLNLKQNKNKEMLQSLESIKTIPDDYIASQVSFLKGCLYNNSGQFKKSVNYFKKSLQFLENYDAQFEKFNLGLSLIGVYFNLGQAQEMLESIKIITNFDPKTQKSKLYIEQSFFSYFLLTGEYENAEQYFNKLQMKIDLFSSIDKVVFYISSYELFINLSQFKKARETIKKLEEIRSFQNSSNLIYMKMMIDHFELNKPLYVYQKDFIKDDFLFHQISVIKSLEEEEISEAKKHWQFLMDVMPWCYQENFEYHGRKSIFKLCLDKYFSQKMSSTTVNLNQEFSTKEEHLVFLIQNGIHNKEELYKHIWGEAHQSKEDLAKLKKLVSRVRAKLGIELKFQKNCYKIAA
jgi:tetratricopeptide (TPR) repeat protein